MGRLSSFCMIKLSGSGLLIRANMIPKDLQYVNVDHNYQRAAEKYEENKTHFPLPV